EGVAHAHLAAVHVPARAGWPAALLSRRRAGPAVDGHEPDARLDEPPGQEQVLPQRVAAVVVAQAWILALQVERLPRPLRGSQFKGAMVQIQPFLLSFAALPLQAVEQLPTAEHALGGLRRDQRI